MSIGIHHNQISDTSRRALQITQNTRSDPTEAGYLEPDGTHQQVFDLFAPARRASRAALRIAKSPAEEMGLIDPAVLKDVLSDNAPTGQHQRQNSAIIPNQKGQCVVG